MPPIIQSSDGKHLGFVPVYFWTDETGRENVHHGRIHPSHLAAEAATRGAKPAGWTAWRVEIQRASTFFEQVTDAIRVRQTMAELLNGADLRRAAA